MHTYNVSRFKEDLLNKNTWVIVDALLEHREVGYEAAMVILQLFRESRGLGFTRNQGKHAINYLKRIHFLRIGDDVLVYNEDFMPLNQR